MLVEKPRIRQSQIGRQYKSGNNAKKLMGLTDLLWSGSFETDLRPVHCVVFCFIQQQLFTTRLLMPMHTVVIGTVLYNNLFQHIQ
jgi:hypothetical protein